MLERRGGILAQGKLHAFGSGGFYSVENFFALFLSLTHIRFGRQNPNCKEASFESFSALDFAANILAAKNIADIAAHTIVFFIITDSLWLLKTVVLLES